MTSYPELHQTNQGQSIPVSDDYFRASGDFCSDDSFHASGDFCSDYCFHASGDFCKSRC